MTLSSRMELVAIDDGFDFTKVVTRHGRSARIPTSFSMSPATKVGVMGRNQNAEHVYEVEGVRCAVGPSVVSCDTRFEDFPYHPANLAVAMDALRRVVSPGSKVHVIAGLPLNRFYSPSGEINATVLSRKASAWSRAVCSLDGQMLPRIAHVSVIAEAVAAWVDFVINDDFSTRDDVINDFMAVVDVGGRTTDIAVFENGDINLALSGTLDRGVLEIQNRVSEVLAAKFPGTGFPRTLLLEAAKFGIAKLGIGDVDVSADVIDARKSLLDGIEQFMQSKFGSSLPLMKHVLFVGGGAHMLQFQLKEQFPRATFATDPQMANARGMLKFGVAVGGFENEQMISNA